MKKITIGLLKLVHVIDADRDEFNGFLATGYKDFVESDEMGFIFSRIRIIIINDRIAKQQLTVKYMTNGFSVIKNQKKENYSFKSETIGKEGKTSLAKTFDNKTLGEELSSLVINIHASGSIYIRPAKLTASLLCFHDAKQQKLDCTLT
ncbi:MAG: hypothetical protein ACTSP4_10750 [Candidatus Hodarchaeales archaeon]